MNPNLDGLSTHVFIKILLVDSFTANHDFDIKSLSETWIVPINDKNINSNENSLARPDHPNNNNQWGGANILHSPSH